MARRLVATGKTVRSVPVRGLIKVKRVPARGSTSNTLPSVPTGKKTGVKRIYYG